MGRKKPFQPPLAGEYKGGDVFGLALKYFLVDSVQFADAGGRATVAAKYVVGERDSPFGKGVDCF